MESGTTEQELSCPQKSYNELIEFMETYFCCSETSWLRTYNTSKIDLTDSNVLQADWVLRMHMLDDILLSGHIYHDIPIPKDDPEHMSKQEYLIYKPYYPPKLL